MAASWPFRGYRSNDHSATFKLLRHHLSTLEYWLWMFRKLFVGWIYLFFCYGRPCDSPVSTICFPTKWSNYLESCPAIFYFEPFNFSINCVAVSLITLFNFSSSELNNDDRPTASAMMTLPQWATRNVFFTTVAELLPPWVPDRLSGTRTFRLDSKRPHYRK